MKAAVVACLVQLLAAQELVPAEVQGLEELLRGVEVEAALRALGPPHFEDLSGLEIRFSVYLNIRIFSIFLLLDFFQYS